MRCYCLRCRQARAADTAPHPRGDSTTLAAGIVIATLSMGWLVSNLLGPWSCQ